MESNLTEAIDFESRSVQLILESTELAGAAENTRLHRNAQRGKRLLSALNNHFLNRSALRPSGDLRKQTGSVRSSSGQSGESQMRGTQVRISIH